MVLRNCYHLHSFAMTSSLSCSASELTTHHQAEPHWFWLVWQWRNNSFGAPRHVYPSWRPKAPSPQSFQMPKKQQHFWTMTMTSSQEPLKLLLKRPVTRQIGEAALRHGLGRDIGFWWLLYRIPMLDEHGVYTVCYLKEGISCSYVLSHISHHLSPTVAHKYEAQTFLPHLSFIDVIRIYHLTRFVVWIINPKGKKHLKSHGFSWHFQTYLKHFEAPCWQLLSPHDLARNDAATVDEALATKKVSPPNHKCQSKFRKFEAYTF